MTNAVIDLSTINFVKLGHILHIYNHLSLSKKSGIQYKYIEIETCSKNKR